MKIKYYDTPDNQDIYLLDQPECKVRIIFHDDGDIFMYYSHEPSSQVYINKVINPLENMFFLSNLEVLKDEEQFDYYYSIINNISNFQGLAKGEELSGSFPNWSLERAIRQQSK